MKNSNSPNLINIYRISDAGRPKSKIHGGSKEACLLNFIKEFGRNNLFVFADNCSEELIMMLEQNQLTYTRTKLGNAGSCKFVFDYVIREFDENDYVNFIEDDYLHLPGSKAALISALDVSDYVSLYEHPDMYGDFDSGTSANPYTSAGSQRCEVFLSGNYHFRSTVSTTMSFALKVGTLKIDMPIWNFFLKGKLPNDFCAFVVLNQSNIWPLFMTAIFSRKFVKAFLWRLYLLPKSIFKKKRILVTPIPSKSTHIETDYLAPNWYNMAAGIIKL